MKFGFKYRLDFPEDYALEEAVKPAGECDPSVALEVDTQTFFVDLYANLNSRYGWKPTTLCAWLCRELNSDCHGDVLHHEDICLTLRIE